jgi:diguanylate cyclase
LRISGDALLQEVGSRLQDALPAPDVVARLGGDEFAVLVPKVVSSEAAVHTAEKILRAVSRSLELHDVPINVEASIGIALYPDHGEDADTLI